MYNKKRLTMKKAIVIAILMSASFMGGIFWEHRASISDYSEWQQIAQEACDMRIKTLKATCKR
jgi:hypothetical protein